MSKTVREFAPHHCPFCDFASGQRGMDRCTRCDGTGSVFVIRGEKRENGTFLPLYFPNTADGFKRAAAIKYGTLPGEDAT